jgi:HEAT repeat protein
MMGDAAAVAPLVETLADGDAASSSRAYAAMALGILGDKRPPRLLLAVQRDLNYLAKTEWLPELLVLN